MKGLKINKAVFLIVMVFFSQWGSAQLNYSVATVRGEKYKVILMAGQSNMVGVGKISELENKNLPENIRYFDFKLIRGQKVWILKLLVCFGCRANAMPVCRKQGKIIF